MMLIGIISALSVADAAAQTSQDAVHDEVIIGAVSGRVFNVRGSTLHESSSPIKSLMYVFSR
jgi:hypothetical protein